MLVDIVTCIKKHVLEEIALETFYMQVSANVDYSTFSRIWTGKQNFSHYYVYKQLLRKFS